MTSTNQSKGGFGPVALIVAGVVCFAAGYMVSDLTRAFTQKVPEHKPGATRLPPAPDERTEQAGATPAPAPAPAPGEGASPGEPSSADKPEDKPAPPAPPSGSGAPPPKP